jgi:hypothetical protein
MPVSKCGLSGPPRNYMRVIWRLGGGRSWAVAPSGGAVSRQSPFVIDLSDADRGRLEALARKQTAQRRQFQRARVVLGAADGEENAAMAKRFGVALNTVIKWRKRFFEEGMEGLEDRKRSGRPRSFSPLWSSPRSRRWLASCRRPRAFLCHGGAARSWRLSW